MRVVVRQQEIIYPDTRRRPGSAGVRAFGRLAELFDADQKTKVCTRLRDIENMLFSDLSTAVSVRDLRTADSIVEELKWVVGSQMDTCGTGPGTIQNPKGSYTLSYVR